MDKPKTPAKTDNSNNYHVPNLDRGLSIFELLSKHPDGLGITEISQITGFPKNSVFRITMTMFNRGFLGRNEKTKQFTLTRKLLDLGSTTTGEMSLVEKSWDQMVALRNIIKETVLVGVLSGTKGVVLEQVLGLYPFNFNILAGAHFHIHSSAPAKSILAFLPDSERDDLLASINYEVFNSQTITNADDYRKELENTRRDGYSVDNAEELDGCHCVSAPIFNSRGYPIAAIWTTGPSNRLKKELFQETGQTIIEHANRISDKIDGKSPTEEV
ncbi:MAG: IclR family transcriptional regulator [Planctomycetes bacterium]|nr:IclR family transcriptional regulator [Planctomycetota bacterium]